MRQARLYPETAGFLKVCLCIRSFVSKNLPQNTPEKLSFDRAIYSTSASTARFSGQFSTIPGLNFPNKQYVLPHRIFVAWQKSQLCRNLTSVALDSLNSTVVAHSSSGTNFSSKQCECFSSCSSYIYDRKLCFVVTG